METRISKAALGCYRHAPGFGRPRNYGGHLTPLQTELVGGLAACVTTLCWVPQAVRILRTRDSRAISLWSQGAFTCGIALWLVNGILIGSWPITAANSVTLVLVGAILLMKLRYG